MSTFIGNYAAFLLNVLILIFTDTQLWPITAACALVSLSVGTYYHIQWLNGVYN